MREKTHNIAVGVTAIVGLAGIVVLLLLFGYLPQWLEGGYEVRVNLSTASGLTEGSRVKLSGIDIGRVMKVQLRQPPDRGVVVHALIRRGLQVPLGSRVKAESPLLGGNPTLAFEMDTDADHGAWQPLATDGSAVIQGEALTMVSQFAGELQAAIAEPTKRFAQIAASFDRLSAQWSLVGENLNRLLEARRVEAVDAGDAVGNLATVLARADARLAELGHTIDGLNQWVGDAELQGDIRATAANARRVSEAMRQSLEHADTLFHSAKESIDRLARRYVAVADDVAATINSARDVLEQVRQGEGTIGLLLNNPDLYRNLSDSSQRLQAVLDEVRLLIQKWKAEGLPVRF